MYLVGVIINSKKFFNIWYIITQIAKKKESWKEEGSCKNLSMTIRKNKQFQFDEETINRGSFKIIYEFDKSWLEVNPQSMVVPIKLNIL